MPSFRRNAPPSTTTGRVSSLFTTFESHGFRPGRGAATAIAEAKFHLAAGYAWVVDLDLSKFFDRVHHQRLLARLGRRVSDLRVLKLVNLMLKAFVVLPIGAETAGESR